MEKFYIVSNEQFLEEISDFRIHSEERRKLAKEFFERKEILGQSYDICGDGSVNKPFHESEKSRIRLYIEDCKENNEKFGNELLKPTKRFCDSDIKMRSFRANSKTLKEFQNLCIERNIVINNHPICEGDYFEELHMGGYDVSRFEYDGKMYLRMNTSRSSITPEYDGFEEIKGSEFYKALEELKKGEEANE